MFLATSTPRPVRFGSRVFHSKLSAWVERYLRAAAAPRSLSAAGGGRVRGRVPRGAPD